jgi:hypothetical protein
VNSERSWDNWWRAGGVFGILFAVLFIVGPVILTGDTPTREDSMEEIRAYFEDDGDLYRIGDYLGGLAFILFFLPYLVILRWVLGSGEGSPPIFSWLAFAGGLALVVFGGATSVFYGALAIAADKPELYAEIDDSSIRMVMEMSAYSFTGFLFTSSLFIGAASVVVLKSGILWRWLGGLGLLAALLMIVGAAWPIEGDDEGVVAVLGFIGAPITMLFIILSSINMLMMKEEPGSAREAPSPTAAAPTA